MTKKYVLFSIILACSWACHKKQNSVPVNSINNGHSPGSCIPHTTYITNSSILSCKYKPGSYWVFKDSLSGNIDTLFAETLTRSSYLFMGMGCDTSEVFVLTLTFKNESISAFKKMNYLLFPDSIQFQNNYLWKVGDQNGKLCLYNTFSKNTGGCIMHDSLLFASRYYRNVGESFSLQFIKDDPNRMETQSMKTFFSPTSGPLQLDFRDRLTGQLTGRRQVIAKNIIR